MYQLPNLPYLYQDLEPFIDTHTMALHHNKHEKTYLNNLNKILTSNNYNYKYKIDNLIYHINDFPIALEEDILFNLGGVLNHELYWKGINKKTILPFGKLKEEIDKRYQNFDNFWNKLKEKAMKLKGSGYTFLIINKEKELEIINVPNQETPLLYGFTPLYNIDLWEHAYYLNYKNDKSKYIDNLKEVADFTYASNTYNNI